MSICPVCDMDVATLENSPNSRDATSVNCQFCGDFCISNTSLATLPHLLIENKDNRFKISHSLRLMQQNNEVAELNSITVEAIIKQALPRPREQADLLIRWIAENSDGPGEPVTLKFLKQGAYIGAKSRDGFILIVTYLFETQLIRGFPKNVIDIDGQTYVALTFLGWEKYEELRLGRTFYRRAFMAMKFGEPELDKIFNTIFKLSSKLAGFELFRLDELHQAGLIDDRIRAEIQSSDFLVADLTHDNHGAYWEAGYAEGLGKPVIYTCEKNKFEARKTHFDTNHHLHILWDVDHLDEARENLKATIRATLPHLALLQDPSE